MKTPGWFLKRNFVAYLLLPLSVAYYIGGKLVYNYRRFFQKSSKIPVICIGNIMSGGVGKTPIVREIAKFLPNSAVIMRGYKGKKAGKVEKNDNVADVGDEAKMLAESGLSVFVGPNRQKSIKMVEKAGFSYVIMDDGFQNPTIRKDVSILVFDGGIGVGNGFLLPAGPLREPVKSGMNRADAILIINSKIKKAASHYKICRSQYKIVPVYHASTKPVYTGIKGDVFAFAGIGYNRKFFDMVENMAGITVIGKKGFPDHYQYSQSDLRRIIGESKEAEILTTEKDWVRLPGEYKKKIKFIPQKTVLEKSFWQWLERKLEI
ncbi:MAG: tetraacyldisaccharide 4'-kinase [Rickettsiales bacterium]|jgi:tetraacyldisaccharide 4'-kinase|nr:tetraacyldisaccharide 4'-kinase [Rickettsiales bacterium]